MPSSLQGVKQTPALLVAVGVNTKAEILVDSRFKRRSA
jgi:hypothetical protein